MERGSGDVKEELALGQKRAISHREGEDARCFVGDRLSPTK